MTDKIIADGIFVPIFSVKNVYVGQVYSEQASLADFCSF